MNEMIERVAKAAHNFNVAGNPKIIFENMPDHYQDTWHRLAKAAIAAMREPTDGMCSQGEIAGQHAVTMWRAMIDAALKE